MLEYLEVGIVEYCNLNCKGCSHFSPLAKRSSMVTVEGYEKDIKRLSELIPVIYKIRLLGGEPLLHPDLNRIVEITRKYYPYSDICIVTNGLLLTSVKNLELWSDYNIKIDISLYPPTELIKDEIKSLLDSKKIRYEFTPSIREFRKILDKSGSQNVNESYDRCTVGKKCKYLYKGMLSGCPAPNVGRIFDRTYNYSLACNEDLIDIHHTSLRVEEIVEKLNSPLKTCRVCTNPEVFKWENSHGNCSENDWIVE